ncbi:MAG: lysophospholipid acyltransferase family protein [Actinobacteria bacterium]|nr:lysophospholipid acyltransferase family protein [Actinomycetota bacterium]
MGYLLYKLGIFLAQRINRGTSFRIARFIARIWYIFDYKNGKALRHNLSVAMKKSMNSKDVRNIGLKVFKNFAKNVTEFLSLPSITREYLAEKISVSGLEKFDAAFRKKRGLILLTSHLGNWEFGGVYVAQCGYPLYAISLPHSRNKIDNIFTEFRQQKGIKSIQVGAGTLREAYRVLKDGNILAFLGDWDPTGSGEYVNFFGKKAHLPKGPVAMALMTGAIIAPALTYRVGENGHHIDFLEPIEVEITRNNTDALVSYLQKISDILGEYIGKHLEYWNMFHKIWEEPFR